VPEQNPPEDVDPLNGAPEELDPQKARRRRRRRILRWVVTIAVVAIVGWFFTTSLIQNWGEVTAENLEFSPLWIVATLLFILAVPTTGILWGWIVRTLDPTAKVQLRESIAVQCLSWVLKYIPGQVGSVVNKTVWAGKKGISRTLVIITFIYENVFLQLASLIPGTIIILLSLGPGVFGDNVTLLLLPAILILPLAVVSWKPVFHKILDFPARRVLKREVPPEYFLSTPKTLAFAVGFVIPRAINGAGFVVLASTIVPMDAGMWLPFAAAYVLAGAIGILAVFVPSGLGVREAVIVAILSAYIPVPQAIVLSLIARLLATIGDAGVALVYGVVRRTIPKEHRP
jgi:glycosyltransferase 2 family protein